MRLRLLARPTGTLDGIALDAFRIGDVYNLSSVVACALLAEGCAVCVSETDREVAWRPAPPQFAHFQLRVLVVEDHPELQWSTAVILTAHGYQVTVAGHGRDAIQRLREQCPDLIVLDLNMPVMNGWQFRAAQRSLPDPARVAVPVLLMTATDDAATHANTLGAAGLVKKPFTADVLIDAVSAAIALPESASGARSA